MDTMRRDALIRYCRIDDPTAEDLQDLDSFYEEAVSYLEYAGVSEPQLHTPRWIEWFLCVKHMVLDAWDSRGATLPAAPAENPVFRRTLNQLKLTEGIVSESDTIPEGGA